MQIVTSQAGLLSGDAIDQKIVIWNAYKWTMQCMENAVDFGIENATATSNVSEKQESSSLYFNLLLLLISF